MSKFSENREKQERSWNTVDVFKRVVAGRESANEDLFYHYLQPLILAARKKMSRKLAARVDPEDVVMSTYRSFFLRARNGNFCIEGRGELWRLLLEITYHKLYRQAAFHRAAKRSFDTESPTDAESLPHSKQSPPDHARILAEEIESAMRRLDATGQSVLQLTLQGFSRAEIATKLQVSDRTVRRHLAKVRSSLCDSLPDRTQTESTSRLENPTNKKDLAPSKQLQEYRLTQQIGAGASGKVYRALQLNTGKEVAIKYLRKEFTQDTSALQRFDAEIQSLSQLAHRSIIRIEGHGSTPGGGRFIAMEFIGGGDLQTQLESTATISIRRAVDWIRQAAVGVSVAHRVGIVHCDLKLANLLLRKTGEIVVTDFGLAQDIRNNLAPTFAGTPAFMAPEQIAPFFGPIGPATDVYGLGQGLYMLLTGQAAFAGEDVSELLTKIVSGAMPPAPDEVRPEIPDAVSQICMRAICKRQTDRFESVDALSSALAVAIESCGS